MKESRIPKLLNFCIFLKVQRKIFVSIKKRVYKKRGPKFTLNKAEKLRIKRTISSLEKSGKKVNSVKIKNICDLNVSQWTIQRHIKRLGFVYKKAKKTNFLTKKHKEERSKLIREWITSNHPWEKTIFSDEKRFSLDGNDDWKSYMKDDQQIIHQKRVSDGGSIMVWMMMMPNGLLSHRVIEEKFNSEKYIKILRVYSAYNKA